nr:STAS domain-containing protein [Kibdelosporangium phytohabitans]
MRGWFTNEPRRRTGRDDTVTGQPRPAQFSCQVHQHDQALVLSVAGPLDLATQPAFAEAVRSALRTDASSVVVDLAAVTFMASPGLAVLVEALEESMRANKSLHVVVGDTVAARSIEVTGLGQVLPLAPDVRTALDG